MRNYTLSTKVNKNRVFILQKNELEKRWDPSWYVYLNSIQGFKHKTVPLRNLLLENPQYGANEIGIERLSNIEPRYIRITDINEFGELENELGKTSSVIEGKYFLKENDLLIARSGNTVGKSYLHKGVGYDCFFAGYMIRFKIDETKVIPEYIFTYTQTDFYKKWIKAIQRTTGQPNINAEEYRSLQIPLPERKTQKRIIDVYFKFIIQKQKNESEAKKLIASIDTYLLSQLDVKIPDVAENTLKSRIFIKTFKEISGFRFDPNFFGLEFSILDTLFAKYSSVKLGDLSIQISDAPHERPEFSENEEVRVIMIENLKPEGIQQNNEKYITERYHQKLKSTILQKYDLLMARIGVTTGVTSKVDDRFVGKNISGNITLIRLDHSKINVYFVLEYLNSYLGRLYSKRILSNSARDFLTVGKIKLIKIPAISTERQKEIAEHITGIRHQVQQLNDRTKELLRKASEEIESILLN